jgi:hypothetical protein
MGMIVSCGNGDGIVALIGTLKYFCQRSRSLPVYVSLSLVGRIINGQLMYPRERNCTLKEHTLDGDWRLVTSGLHDAAEEHWHKFDIALLQFW